VAGARSKARGPVRALPVALLVVAVCIAGCGGGDSPASTGGQLPVPDLSSRGAPPANETFEEARTRIDNVIRTGNCGEINALSLLTTAAAGDSGELCRSLQAVAGLKALGAADYGDQAGVIDFAAGDHVLSMVVLRDSDGLFHVAFVSPFNGQTTINTPLATGFHAAAGRAVAAIRDRDCAGFLAVANRRLGPGTLPPAQACDAVTAPGGLSDLLKGSPKTKPISLGGNGFYAFYAVPTRTAFLALVMAKETNAVPPSIASTSRPLPRGAPRYGYVQAYQTGPAGKS
jgi:hypothetical protein